MPIKAVLFDLDGTLLPMDQDVFVKNYFGLLIKKLMPYGYEPESLMKAIWSGTGAMVKNTGEKTNEEVFWDTFAQIYGEQVKEHLPLFEEFYEKEFQLVKASCGFTLYAAETISLVKSLGLYAVLATNPIFPRIATESRIRWAGLSPENFEYFTVYENSRHSKPNPEYYRDILAITGLKAEESIMVGNDVDEDMVAETLGLKVFLLTDCLINRSDKDISQYPNGSFPEFFEFLSKACGK